MIKTIIYKILNLLYKLRLKNSIIESNVSLLKSKINENTRICNNTIFRKSFLDSYSYIGENCNFYQTRIGKYCSISKNVSIILGKHPSNKFVSTHPVFYSLRKQVGTTFITKQKFDEFKLIDDYSLVIGNDVWIGDGVKIIEGLKIGDGAIIASGSIVTKDIEPYSINGGIPSKIIKYRFEEKYINWLLDFKWWNKDLNWIKENADYFDNIESFYERYNK
jgi:acetyltransferase-like isoleucine patch superfamily enzyme